MKRIFLPIFGLLFFIAGTSVTDPPTRLVKTEPVFLSSRAITAEEPASTSQQAAVADVAATTSSTEQSVVAAALPRAAVSAAPYATLAAATRVAPPPAASSEARHEARLVGAPYQDERMTATLGIPSPALHVGHGGQRSSGSGPQPRFSTAGANVRVTQAEVDALEAGLSSTLTAIENSVVTEVFGETLPLVGNNFQVAWSNNVAGFRYLTKLRGAVVSGLATLTGAADYSLAEVAAPINSRLVSSNFIASSVSVTTANNEAQLTFITSDTFTAGAVPLEQDFGIPNLDLHFTGTPSGQTTTAWAFNFSVGVDGGGFYLTTPATAFSANTTTTINSLNAAGRFTKLPHTITDNNTSGATRTSIPANFAITLKDPDNKVRLNELSGTDLLDATVTGSTKLAVKLLSSVPTSAMLPQVGTDLNLIWVFSAAPVDPTDDNETFGNRPLLSLDNNRINLDSFFNSFAGRALEEVVGVTAPLQPVIDVLTVAIPLLSDLGSDDVTILDLFGVSPELVDAIGGLGAVLDLANTAGSFSGNGNVFTDLGDYSLASGDIRMQTLDEIPGSVVNPPSSTRDADLNDFMDLASGIEGLNFPLLTNATVVANLLLGRDATLFSYQTGELGFDADLGPLFFPVLGPVGVTLGGNIGMKTEFGFGYDTRGLYDFSTNNFVNPDLLFNGFYAMALGNDGSPLTGIELSFGVTAGVELNLAIASVGVEGDITATVGIYLDDLLGDEEGRVRGNTLSSLPVDSLFYAAGQLSAGLRAYLEIGWPPFGVEFEFESPRVVILNFDSRDTDVPVLAEPGSANPAQLVLNIGDRAHRRIHGNLDDRAEEIAITNVLGNLVVSGFGHENTFSDPFVQIVANSGNRGDIIYVHPDVTIPVLFSGGDKRDLLTGGGGWDELTGGDGPDKLRGQGGQNIMRGEADNDELIGGLGINTFDGGPGNDTASWADSAGSITFDLRTGVFTGVAVFDTLISIERYKGTFHDDTMDGSEGPDQLLRGLKGNDLIRGHGGDDLLEGDAGDDTVLGGAGNDMVNGGAGADVLDGGDGIDTLSYLASGLPLLLGIEGSPVTVSLLTGTGTRGDAVGDVFSNFEILIGSGVPQGVNTPAGTGDYLTGSDNADTIHGMGGTDLIRGAGGNDILFGDNNIFPTEYPADVAPLMAGFDADTIYGDAGDDQLFGQTDNDKLYGGENNDMLDGGLGDDDLDGDGGTDTLIGGEGNDHLITIDLLSADFLDGGAGTNRLSADYSDHAVPLRFTTGTNNAFTFPGGDRFTNMFRLGSLTTGPSNDIIRLSPRGEDYMYPKMINAGGGDDLVVADSRHYYLLPNGNYNPTGDSVHGGDGNDTLSFEHARGEPNPYTIYDGARVNLALGTIFEIDYRPLPENPPNPDFEFMHMSGFENLIGSEHIDNLTGDAGPNIINPLGNGRANQTDIVLPDRIFGGEGVDTLRVDYSKIPLANLHGVNMFVPSGLVDTRDIAIWGYQGTAPGGAVILNHIGFERFEITGGNGPDTLFGSRLSLSFPDIFYGGGGNDIIDAGNGDDLVDGGEGDDDIDVYGGNDIVRGGPGNDRISGNRELVVVDPTQGLGFDLIEAGPGDDFVIDYYPNNQMPIAAHATTRLRLDGGSGFDALTADFSNQTQPILFDQNHPSDHVFPDGSWFIGFEKLVDFYSGDGPDVLIFTGREDNTVRLQGGNDILNPGLGKDVLYGGAGDDLLILDYSVGDDADTAGVIESQRRRITSGAVLDQLSVVEFERMHFTGTSKADTMTGLIGDDRLFGGAGNDTLRGAAGHDWLDGGPGADTMDGFGGNDTFIVDDPGDVVTDGNGQGTDTVRSAVNFALPVNVEILTLTGNALNGTGNTLSNNITGNTRNNYLRGEGGNDLLNGSGGAGEIDRLNGGANADTFVLGEGTVRFYDDGSPFSPGLNGYAIIEDFTPSQTDKLRLSGTQAQYLLGASPVIGTPGTALYHDSNGNAALDVATDELIAILVSGETLTSANTLATAVYPGSIDLAIVGLTSPIQPIVTDDGSGPRFAVQFSILDPMPAGALLEIQTSTDLGFLDTWLTISSKNGPAAWIGLAPVTVSPPANGRVTITVNDLLPIAQRPQNFFRVKLTAP